jgi:hypothetical protein
VARIFRIEIPVITVATPSSSTIRPMICDSNSELVSEIGMTEDVATAFWPWLVPGAVFGAGLGADDGLISGNRLAALPAGTLTVPPVVPEPATGSAPTGSAPTGRAATGTSAPRLLVVPGRLGTVAADPLDEDPLEEPAEPPAPDFALELGLGDADVFATVTVGALALAVSGEPPPLATETVAENWIVSPAGAVLGTLTCASICGAAGCFTGRVRL